MTAEADAIGWAVREADGSVHLPSISESPSAALKTWFRERDLVWSLNDMTDVEIEAAFKTDHPRARLIKVSIIEIDR